MFITQAFAQSAPASTGSLFDLFFPLAMVFLIVYFMIIRPQNKRQKEHQNLIDGLRRGDTVVTQGGLIGKIAKVEDNELQIDIAKDVRVTIVRSMILTVRSKTEPAEKK